MSDIAEQLHQLRQYLDGERRVRVCIQETQELERSRTTALEDTANAHVRYFPEIRNTLNILNNNIKANKRRLADHIEPAAKALDKIRSDIEAVLNAHTQSIFRLETRLDRIAEQFAAAGFTPINDSNGENIADANHTHAEAPVNVTEHVIDAARTHTRRSSGPRPTVPAEQRAVS